MLMEDKSSPAYASVIVANPFILLHIKYVVMFPGL